MCGIIAVVGSPSDRVPPTTPELLAGIRRAAQAADAAGHGWAGAAAALEQAADALHDLDGRLRGTPGVRALLADPAAMETLDRAAEDLDGVVAKLEDRLDADPAFSPSAAGPSSPNGRAAMGAAMGADRLAGAEARAGDLERINAALLRCKDLLWALRRDRIAAARAIAGLLGDAPPGGGAVEAFTAVQIALSALDRLEVRGRDSAGLHILVTGHGLDLADPAVAARLAGRGDPLFGSTAVRTPGDQLSFVYKAASEIGELGDNVRKLRAEITADDLLHQAVAAPGARAVVLAHTRWASVGLINQANAHPLNAEEAGDPVDGRGPYVVAALNGDVDNYQALIAEHGLRPPEEITTDAKVIPVLVARRLAGGDDLPTAFRATVAEFEGSVAIAANATAEPGRVLLALRGSGQALYVGLADDRFVVASEPYGVVEQCGTYLRMDGEALHDDGSRGQVVALDADRAGTIEGIWRASYAGTELPVGDGELHRAEITTRDIDRGGAAHYLLKEISEAPTSMRKTLRGRVRENAAGGLAVALGDDTLPRALRDRLADGQIRRVAVIGQGTAAVAGMAAAAAIGDALAGSGIVVEPVLATELSGFGLASDLRDHLVVAISQSGTTTDTNRAVDLVRGRGGMVVAIVNRRGSDLVHKADGVLLTSDGRDVEMSVASTKAFYAQVAAGQLLALALADAAGRGDPARAHELLTALRALPEAMEQVIGGRQALAELARRWAPVRRHWAVTGNGRNRIAAEELRIKLSELCYKSIACDATEDKKHIDLSSEPMTLVCAAGLAGSAADDAAKEVAIFAAHKGVPIVLATEGEARYTAAAGLVTVPAVHPDLAFVLSTVAGHLFGYEAALAIDALALPLRSARAAIERAAAPASPVAADAPGGDDLLGRVRGEVAAPLAEFRRRLAAGDYDGVLAASVAARLAAAVRYADGSAPLEAYTLDFGRPGTPGVVVEDLAGALTAAIDELTRPVDAIKHQAKTVTVGTSRADETLLTIPLVRRLLALGVSRERVGYGTLQALAALDPAVAEVTGATRYALRGDPAGDDAELAVLAKTGVAEGLTSRAETDPRLRGTKRLVALERQVLAARGASDGRTVVFVPEVSGVRTTGLTLLHVRFRDRLDPAQARRTLDGYRGRLAKLTGAVTETEPRFDDRRLADLPVEALLTEPVEQLAAHWRSA
jgi:glucosamine--fructose-6-phosphate aminotransferase (isomerizing)